MSRKFASITGSLLMRKGEAGPSSGMQLRDPLPQHALRQQEQRPQENWYERASQPAPDAPEVAPQRVSPLVAKSEAAKPQPAAKPKAHSSAESAARHRIALRLTDDQFRRLGIAAARTHLTMQEFMAEALDARVTTLAETELAGCRCLHVGGSCSDETQSMQCGTTTGNKTGE
ncbi:hypothetical protein F2P47_03200 [Parvibaculum sedimenti]|uniref:Uncharacterized protein n=1 Tax=Parvibaculum sedimenti TaxID=2608632 RepID=A0A6N6VMM3_9HYPH|nr:hypothetical protein [Parvibaculum sedimenti]KAB7742284.1 hypothetical protein F2P47_03200 [Parvibaculum sedimenti]